MFFVTLERLIDLIQTISLLIDLLLGRETKIRSAPRDEMEVKRDGLRKETVENPRCTDKKESGVRGAFLLCPCHITLDQ
jgi:hypothetical protein